MGDFHASPPRQLHATLGAEGQSSVGTAHRDHQQSQQSSHHVRGRLRGTRSPAPPLAISSRTPGVRRSLRLSLLSANLCQPPASRHDAVFATGRRSLTIESCQPPRMVWSENFERPTTGKRPCPGSWGWTASKHSPKMQRWKPRIRDEALCKSAGERHAQAQLCKLRQPAARFATNQTIRFGKDCAWTLCASAAATAL